MMLGDVINIARKLHFTFVAFMIIAYHICSNQSPLACSIALVKQARHAVRVDYVKYQICLSAVGYILTGDTRKIFVSNRPSMSLGRL